MRGLFFARLRHMKKNAQENAMPDRDGGAALLAMAMDFLRSVGPWLSTIALSTWGGLVQYAQRVRSGEPFAWRALVIDLVISSFAGILTYLLCQASGIAGPVAAVLIAVSGHMGTRAIASLEAFRERVFGSGPGHDK